MLLWPSNTDTLSSGTPASSSSTAKVSLNAPGREASYRCPGLWSRNCPDTARSQPECESERDLALLAALIACGLCRTEAAELTFEHIQQREINKGGRITLDTMSRTFGSRSRRTTSDARYAKLAHKGRAAFCVDLRRSFHLTCQTGLLSVGYGPLIYYMFCNTIPFRWIR